MKVSVAPGIMLGFAGVTVRERSVTVEGFVLVLPPLQPVTSARIRTGKNRLYNFIDAHFLRDQIRCIGAALHVSHVFPIFSNEPVRFVGSFINNTMFVRRNSRRISLKLYTVAEFALVVLQESIPRSSLLMSGLGISAVRVSLSYPARNIQR
jgi:hypothetical protein